MDKASKIGEAARKRKEKERDFLLTVHMRFGHFVHDLGLSLDAKWFSMQMQELIDAFDPYNDMILLSWMRGEGSTTMLLLLALYQCQLRPGQKIAIKDSITWEHLRDILDRSKTEYSVVEPGVIDYNGSIFYNYKLFPNPASNITACVYPDVKENDGKDIDRLRTMMKNIPFAMMFLDGKMPDKLVKNVAMQDGVFVSYRHSVKINKNDFWNPEIGKHISEYYERHGSTFHQQFRNL